MQWRLNVLPTIGLICRADSEADFCRHSAAEANVRLRLFLGLFRFIWVYFFAVSPPSRGSAAFHFPPIASRCPFCPFRPFRPCPNGDMLRTHRNTPPSTL